MTYDRMKAKPIPGEHCRFCGEDSVPLVKTRCCDLWICCDTDYLSFSGGGYCQFQHEHYSICHFHFNEGHKGKWQECDECREDLGNEEFESESGFRINTPRFLKKMERLNELKQPMILKAKLDRIE